MDSTSSIKPFDWIEREVSGGYCRWAQVLRVHDDETVEVVYLDGDQPVKDDMRLVDGEWELPEGASGIKINAGADGWVTTLRKGPPYEIRGAEHRLVYLHTQGVVWLRGGRADLD